MEIYFFTEDTQFTLPNSEDIKSWLTHISSDYGFRIQNLNYIFCSDDYLLEMNRDHLAHDYYTDIITFDHSEEKNSIEGDIFISIDRVTENAKDLGTSFQEELERVMAHGLLHLIGYNDHTEKEKKVMREKEDACLSLRKH